MGNKASVFTKSSASRILSNKDLTRDAQTATAKNLEEAERRYQELFHAE
jgi:hypothetical protein